MAYLALFLSLLVFLLIVMGPICFVLFLVSLPVALLGAGVLMYRIYRGVLWFFRVPQEKGYLLNMVRGAWEETAWGFILPFTILYVAAEDLKAVLES